MSEAELSPDVKQALARVADFVFRERYDTDWNFAVDMSGADVDWDRHPRLIRSQSFRDPDYPSAILRLLKDVYQTNPGAAEALIVHVIGGEVPDDPLLESALITLGIMQAEGKTKTKALPPISRTFRYIEVDSYPDDFYSDLIRIINRAYNSELYVPVLILVRKLFENALIDIFRTFYGMQAVQTFYDTKNRKLHDFSLLLRTAREKLGDFGWIKDYFNESLLNILDKYREQGNASAHNLAVMISKEEIDRSRDDIIYATKSLFKILSSVVNAKSRE